MIVVHLTRVVRDIYGVIQGEILRRLLLQVATVTTGLRVRGLTKQLFFGRNYIFNQLLY